MRALAAADLPALPAQDRQVSSSITAAACWPARPISRSDRPDSFTIHRSRRRGRRPPAICGTTAHGTRSVFYRPAWSHSQAVLYGSFVSPNTAISSPANGVYNSILTGGTTIGSLTFPANSLTVGKTISLLFNGKITIGTATAIQMKVFLGSSLVCAGQSPSISTVTNAVVYSDGNQGLYGIQVQVAGSSGQVLARPCRIVANGVVMSATSGGSTALIYNSTTGPGMTQTSVNTTVSNLFDFQMAFVTGSTSSFQLLNACLSVSG